MPFISNGGWDPTGPNLPALPAVKSVSSAYGQINVDALLGTFTRLTGSFIADGFIGSSVQSITPSGFVDPGNNNARIILTVTATVITVTSLIGLVTATGNGDELIKDTNYLHYYTVTVAGGPYSYANAEAGQSYAADDVVVAMPGSATWVKNPANFSLKEYSQLNYSNASPRSMEAIATRNEIIIGALPPPRSTILLPPHAAWAYGRSLL